MDFLILRKLADKSGERPTDDEGNLLPWPLAGVRVEDPVPQTHVFSRGWLEQAISEGWCDLDASRIVIHAEDRELSFLITRRPGQYCQECGVAWEPGHPHVRDDGMPAREVDMNYRVELEAVDG